MKPIMKHITKFSKRDWDASVIAVCSCGWVGPSRGSMGAASTDATQHQKDMQVVDEALNEALAEGKLETGAIVPATPEKTATPVTRRDYFAAHAPLDIPLWFEFEFGEPRPKPPKAPGPVRGHTEDTHHGVAALARRELGRHNRDMEHYRAQDKQWCARWEMAKLVAWRYAYADAMLEQGGRDA